ncbi:hypothetical protein FACS1894201_04600 [Bacteroidia bacterium]|nr:hypothetical protein FACS1894201_04600 [Bacteroidia bacterium]
MAHTLGFGAGFRTGKIRTLERYTFQEFEFAKLNHSKAKKQTGMSQTLLSRRYIYGGINELFVLRYGVGTQTTTNQKPYWGGLEVGYQITLGAQLGIALPQFLRVRYIDSISKESTSKVEQFDANNDLHNEWGNIYSRGPWFKGFTNPRVYPGLYFQFGFNFDFGKYQEIVQAIEAGVMIDYFPIPVPMMAHRPKSWGFINFYLTYHFGKRY